MQSLFWERMKWMMGGVLLVVGTLSVNPAHAAPVTVTLEGRVTFVPTALVGGPIHMNDPFRFTATYDNSTGDVNPDPLIGAYDGAITSWFLDIDMGGYQAAGPGIPPSTDIILEDRPSMHVAQLTVRDSLTDDGPINGRPFSSARFIFQDPTRTALPTISLAAFQTLDLGDFVSPSATFAFGFGNNISSQITSMSFSSPVPIPSSLLLFVTGLSVLVGWRFGNMRSLGQRVN